MNTNKRRNQTEDEGMRMSTPLPNGCCFGVRTNRLKSNYTHSLCRVRKCFPKEYYFCIRLASEPTPDINFYSIFARAFTPAHGGLIAGYVTSDIPAKTRRTSGRKIREGKWKEQSRAENFPLDVMFLLLDAACRHRISFDLCFLFPSWRGEKSFE